MTLFIEKIYTAYFNEAFDEHLNRSIGVDSHWQGRAMAHNFIYFDH